MKFTAALLLLGMLAQLPILAPVRRTESVPHDPDDPAIWVNPIDPAKSLIFGTDKTPGVGGLYVFGLNGKIVRAFTPLDRPNNVDVGYGLRTGAIRTDIAVVTERLKHRLRIFGIARDTGEVRDLAPEGLPVLAGETGAASEPMGIALYERPRDGAVFAIVAPKTGGTTNYLWQYELRSDGNKVTATFVRRFGAFSRVGPMPGDPGEIEAVVVDDELGFVYYADERYGIRKYHADPEHPDAAKEIAVLGRSGYQGDREGLAIYAGPNGGGYLVSSDQVPGATRLMIYSRIGPPGRPNEQPLVATLRTRADSTDGLEVSAHPFPGFPSGLLIMMNSSPRNFLIYDWNEVVKRIVTPASR